VPPGWAGKLWALRAGVEAAGDVGLLLFTDADISHASDSLARLVAVAEDRRLDLVSQMARLHCRTGWERLIVPAFVYFFALLYPMRWVNRPGARTAAAAGGCVLLRREALHRAGGLDAIHGAIIDDVALAAAVKRSGGRVYLGLAGTVASVRPYPSLASLWHMVARSATPSCATTRCCWPGPRSAWPRCFSAHRCPLWSDSRVIPGWPGSGRRPGW